MPAGANFNVLIYFVQSITIVCFFKKNTNPKQNYLSFLALKNIISGADFSDFLTKHCGYWQIIFLLKKYFSV